MINEANSIVFEIIAGARQIFHKNFFFFFSKENFPN
jgi:hypothetical protein